ncbi:carboxymuconolactone decarboxylase family protein [Methanolobus sp. WCC5]|jgi:AhpD family alkylhydroperoxidase|uniref:carboxymuconolactone decarboxylase family protein n=1 Tax=Methanolobus sp. WCC5 TaxID=3125785 RepID=UPI003246697E
MTYLNERLPETAEAFANMRASIFKDNSLDTRTKELIATACSVLLRCEKCAVIHSQRAKEKGATEDEIAEALSVAMFIAAGSQLHWTNAYEKIL